MDELHEERKHYFRSRALAAIGDLVVFFVLYFLYIRCFGSATRDGYQVEGCGHLFVLFIVWLSWFALPESLFGRTLGKWAMDLKVVNMAGGPVGFGQAIVRHLFDVIDLSFFGLVGYLVARSTSDRQRVGDVVAKTRVVVD